MIGLHTPIIQSPLLIFILTIISGIIGYYIKYLIDLKKSKHLKILNFDLNISRPCIKTLNPNGYLPPTISIKLENSSKTDITIKGFTIKNKKQPDIFPAEYLNKNESTKINQYEISSFWYECQMRNIVQNKDTKEITEQYLRTINTPLEFFDVLYWYFYHSTDVKTTWKDFEKKLSDLIFYIYTNIGDYERKINKKELKNIKKIMLGEFKKRMK